MSNRASFVAINRCLQDAGVLPSRTMFLDNWYDCPTEAWLADVFPKDLAPELAREGLITNTGEENNDCDDFAVAAWNCARKLHRLTRERNNGFGLGVFAYERERDMVGHAVNVGMICDGWNAAGWPMLRPVFFDPGLMAIVILTLQEMRSCELYLF